MAEDSERHGKTLFIRNLPFSTSNEDLEKVFSDIGPLKTCFVVSDKDSKKCRGFGYVKFTMLEDAEKALKDITSVNGRKVHIMFSKKKEKKKKFGAKTKPIDTEEENDRMLPKPVIQEKTEKDGVEKENKVLKDKSKTTAKSPKPKVKKETPVKGQKQEVNPKTEGKRARLIVRNLAFKMTTEELTEAFNSHGKVTDVHIPKKKNKRMGFAFIQMSNKAQAGMAMKALTGQELKGRKIAVDWALPKDKFEAKQETKEESSDESEEEMEVDANEENGDVSDSEEEMKVEENSDGDEDDDEDDGDDSEEDESEEEESSGSEEDTEDEDEEDEDKKKDTSKPKQNDRPSDVEEGRTVFVRNLPFSVGEEDVVEFFSEYGDVKYAKLVKDKNSGMPRGSAFVQFKSKEFADKCLKECGEEGGSGISMGGRDLYVSLALTKQKAVECVSKKNEKKEQKDSRNLYLAREGMIRAGTEAAKDCSAADLALRTKIDAAKRRKLKDQNVFVSSVRLCIHNLPATVTDKQLRGVCLKAAQDKTAKITECRIMRDLERPNAQGVGKSRGYAFCSFKSHEHALAALRWLNNNAEPFGDTKRPVVEFSLENRKALEAKEKRLEKFKAKQAMQFPKPSDKKADKKRRKKSKVLQGGEANPLTVRKQQDQVARSLHKGKPLGLPSHSGPKQRHKPRPQQPWQKDNKKNNKFGKNKRFENNRERDNRRERVPKQTSGKRKLNTDGFDRMVASYKQKIMKSAQNLQL